MAADMEKVAQAFVQHYYTQFDTNRNNLLSLYQEQSMMSFESEKFQGAQAIVKKLASLPFQQVVHSVKTMDVHPSGANNGCLIVVCGDLKVDGSENPMKFSQTFHIMPTTGGSWWVHNDIFRLNIG